jgi:hypothetical protein
MPKKIKLSKGKEAQKFVNDMTMNPEKKNTYKGGNYKKAIDNVEEAAKQSAKDQFKEYKPEKIKTKSSDKKMAKFNRALKIRGAREEGDQVKKYKDNRGKLQRSKSFDMPTFKRTKNETKLLSKDNRKRKRTATIPHLSSFMKTNVSPAASVKNQAAAQQKGAALLKGKY